MTDWRVPEPPAGAVPLPPVSIQEKVEAAPLEQAPPKPEGFKGLPVRLAGDKIWLLKDGKRSWITSADVYAKLGFKFGDEKELDSETLMCIPEGVPLK